MNWGMVIGIIVLITLLFKNMDLVRTGIESITGAPEKEPISGENLVERVIGAAKENIVVPIWLLVLVILLILVVK